MTAAVLSFPPKDGRLPDRACVMIFRCPYRPAGHPDWLVDLVSRYGDSAGIIHRGQDRELAIEIARKAANDHDADLSLGDAE